MATVLIDTPSGQPYYNIRTDLDGVEFSLTFRYLERQDCWLLDIADASDVPILSGMRLVASTPLLAQSMASNRPPGEMFVLDSTGKDKDPGYNDLGIGSRCQLTYTEVADLSVYA